MWTYGGAAEEKHNFRGERWVEENIHVGLIYRPMSWITGNVKSDCADLCRQSQTFLNPAVFRTMFSSATVSLRIRYIYVFIYKHLHNRLDIIPR
jgi:hypothetical protein